MKSKKTIAIILAALMLISAFAVTVYAEQKTYKEQLAEIIEYAENFPPPGSNVASGSTLPLEEALEEAKNVYENPDSTEFDYYAQIQFIEQAIDKVVFLDVNTDKLWEAMEFANSLNPDDYFTTGFEALKAVSNDYFILHYAQSQKEVDEATERIYEAINNLVPLPYVSVPAFLPAAEYRFIKALNAAEKEVNTVGGNPEASSYQKLLDTYYMARDVYEVSEELDYDTYIYLATELENALEALVYLHWDTKALEATIEFCQSINLDECYSVYVEEYKEVYLQGILALHYGRSQEEVDTANILLTEAVRRLIYINDACRELSDELDFIKTNFIENKDKYTEESFKNLADCYQLALELISTDAPAEDALLQAVCDLRDCTDRLAEVGEVIPTEPGEATEATEPVEDTTASEETTVPTTEATEAPAETTTETLTDTTEVASTTATSEDSTTETTTESTASSSKYIVGDVDQNQKVNIKDATAIQKYIAKLISLEPAGLMASDCNQDTLTNIKDATEIQKFIANLPCNKTINTEVLY